MFVPEKYLPIEQCEVGKVYQLRSRNLLYGVYTSLNGFIGIRTKFGDRYLFEEYHYDKGAPYGTAFPLKEIGTIPQDIPLQAYLGSFDTKTGREVEFDKPVADGGKGWYYLDTGECSMDIRPCVKHNGALFNFLDKFAIED